MTKTATQRICPPAPITTPEQDLAAQIEYFFAETICDGLFAVDLARRLLDRLKPLIAANPEWLKEYEGFLSYAVTADRCMEIENLHAYVAAKSVPWIKQALSEPHCGDCTAHSAPCSRCHAEGYYGLPTSTDWKGSTEGWRLWHEYQAEQNAD